MVNRTYEKSTEQQSVAQTPTYQPAPQNVTPGLDRGVASDTAVLQRMTNGRLARAGNALVQLQRSHGNHHVQRVVAAAKNRTGLPDDLKTGVETLSGLSLDDVRVHYNSPKPAQLEALAYTQGTDIHVSPGQETNLPHETWHVVQQLQGRVQPTMELGNSSINDHPRLEAEADKMGQLAAQGFQLKANPVKETSTQAPSLVIQMKRKWQKWFDKADYKWQDWTHLNTEAGKEFMFLMTTIKSTGNNEEKTNPDPMPENKPQTELAVQTEGVYEWVKFLNSTAGGKLLEMDVHRYHRTRVPGRAVQLGISDVTDPDLIVSYKPALGVPVKRAEEIKAVSVPDPSQVRSQIQSAQIQLDKPRASATLGFNQWKIRTSIRDLENPWPGTDSAPATSKNFTELLLNQLLSIKWLSDKHGWNMLNIYGVNDPRVTIDDHRAGKNKRDALEVEAYGKKEKGKKGYMTKYTIKFSLFDNELQKKTSEIVFVWDYADGLPKVSDYPPLKSLNDTFKKPTAVVSTAPHTPQYFL